MARVLGVDGCRGGWVAAIVDLPGGSTRSARLRFAVVDRLAQLLEHRPDVLAVDVPIGLPDDGQPRAADRAARALLAPRGSSVFPAPRVVLGARTYAEACARARAVTGKAVTLQTWNIVDKVAEADVLAGEVDPRVLVEVHPESSFAVMAGAPLRSRKRTAVGRAERLDLLRAAWPLLPLAEVPGGDDAVDALAAAWSGARWLNGDANVLGDGERDAEDRPMRIVV